MVCVSLIGATDELLIYVFGVPLDSIRNMDLACGGPMLSFSRVGGLLWAFGFLDFCLAFGTLLVGYQDILLLVGFWRAFNWLLLGLWWGSVMFIFHGLFCCFGGLGGFLLCWWWLMSDYVWLFISFCLCEILVDVLQAFACLLLVWALVFSEPLFSLFLVVGFQYFYRGVVCFRIIL